MFKSSTSLPELTAAANSILCGTGEPQAVGTLLPDLNFEMRFVWRRK